MECCSSLSDPSLISGQPQEETINTYLPVGYHLLELAVPDVCIDNHHGYHYAIAYNHFAYLLLSSLFSLSSLKFRLLTYYQLNKLLIYLSLKQSVLEFSLYCFHI